MNSNDDQSQIDHLQKARNNLEGAVLAVRNDANFIARLAHTVSVLHLVFPPNLAEALAVMLDDLGNMCRQGEEFDRENVERVLNEIDQMYEERKQVVDTLNELAKQRQD
jgi:hypothetical protein